MEKMLKKPDYAKEILEIMHGSFSEEDMLERISDYHENDMQKPLNYCQKRSEKDGIGCLVRNRLQRFFLILMIRIPI